MLRETGKEKKKREIPADKKRKEMEKRTKGKETRSFRRSINVQLCEIKYATMRR